MTDTTDPRPAFGELNLIPAVLTALNDLGYESPSPIQAATIPHLMAGHDLVGQAQTGTGKTAAFALPLLSRVDPGRNAPQALVLAPTRELAIQVAEAFQRYAHHMRGFHVLPIYGGQDYRTQLRGLRRGPQVIVGTPGRVMDHMRRGTLDLSALATLVLDEADEMLRMGFVDDVAWILERIPEQRQIALFSATMPAAVRNIAERYLCDPARVTIRVKTATAETIRQRYWTVNGRHKLDALTRIMEAEPFDAMIVFVRTRTATADLAERLAARGYAAEALNGDVPQKQREQIVNRLRNGITDVLVATDVAARGLDVARISHVINYDVPHDTESYIHRIGRTGRAGRTGDAILFVAPRERRMLAAIERATRQKIDRLSMPTAEVINDRRVADFKRRITEALAAGDLEPYAEIVEQYRREHDVPFAEIAAALAGLLQGDTPLLLEDAPPIDAGREGGRRERRESNSRVRAPSRPRPGTERFRLEVGAVHGAKPGNVVGAIANELGLEGRLIDRVTVRDDHTTVDLPEGMPRELFHKLKGLRVAGRRLNASRVGAARGAKRRPGPGGGKRPGSKGKPKRRA